MGPWLLFQDTASLDISRQQLGSYTQQAQEAFRQRQHDIEFVQRYVWLAALVLFLLGLALLVRGAWRMRSAQRVEDRTLEAQAKQQEASVEPQTPDDKRRRAANEVVEESIEAGLTRASTGEIRDKAALSRADGNETELREHELALERQPHPSAAQTEREASLRHLERRALDQLSERCPTGWKFLPQVKVVGDSEKSDLYLDGLFQSSAEDYPDCVVDVKIRTAPTHDPQLQRQADLLLGTVARYESATGKHARSWLVIIYRGVNEELEQLRDYGAGIFGVNVVTILGAGDLDRLSPPPVLFDRFRDRPN